jgi:hypothetical protein
VSSRASITSGTSAALNDGPTTLPAWRRRTGGAVRAAQRDLVPLLAVLVDAQDADVAAVVVAAAVDAAADVQVDLAQVVQLVQVLVALGDGSAIGSERALASEQKSPPGQAIMSVSRPMLGGPAQRAGGLATGRAGRSRAPRAAAGSGRASRGPRRR